MTTCAPGVGQQELVQGGRAGLISQEGADVNKIRHAGHPQGIAGRSVKSCCARCSNSARASCVRPEFAVDQRQARAPSASHGVLLDEVAHDGFEFFEAALLAAQGKHLRPKMPAAFSVCRRWPMARAS